MRTSIVVDDRLVREAMKLAGAKTLREAVEIALRRFVLHDDRDFEAIAAVTTDFLRYLVRQGASQGTRATGLPNAPSRRRTPA